MIASVRPTELDLTNWDLGGPISEWSYRQTAKLSPLRSDRVLDGLLTGIGHWAAPLKLRKTSATCTSA